MSILNTLKSAACYAYDTMRSDTSSAIKRLAQDARYIDHLQ